MERRLELRLGLAAEADDDVGRDGDVRDGAADAVEPLEVVLDRVLPAHPLEDAVVAGLDGQVERLADRRAVGHGIDQPIREVPRVRGDEPEAWDRRAAVGRAEVVDRADELREVRAAPEVELAARPALGADVPDLASGARSCPYELTFWPRSVTSRKPCAAIVRASSTISSNGRDRSGPRLNGTMQ